MCRMLFSIGDTDINKLLDSAISMAKDEIYIHELNQDKGLGTWKHEDGWGIAFLDENNNWVIKKSTKSIFEDPLIEEARKIKTRLAIIHIRKSTVGDVSFENTHPFHENGLVFCHNGTVKDEIKFSAKFQPKGTTDSEKLFLSLLTDLEKLDNQIEAIKNNLKKYKDFTCTNIILASKNKTFIATNWIKDTLFPKYRQMSLARYNNSTIVSSDSLPNIHTEWKTIDTGNIIEIDNLTGKIKIHKDIFS